MTRRRYVRHLLAVATFGVSIAATFHVFHFIVTQDTLWTLLWALPPLSMAGTFIAMQVRGKRRCWHCGAPQ